MYQEDFKRYLEDLASKKPAPGGGSASSLVSCLGVALLEMVCNFTLGKDKYKDVEEEIRDSLNRLKNLRIKLEELIDEDVLSYNRLSLAYKLPEEETREEKIKEALKSALEVVVKISEVSFEALCLAESLVDKINPNLITDIGGGVLFLEAGFNSAVLNVKINLKGLKDKALSQIIEEKIEKQTKQVIKIKEEVLKKVDNKITLKKRKE